MYRVNDVCMFPFAQLQSRQLTADTYYEQY
jgi:hypothetical protein